jgi:hypothetical protein
MDKMFEMRSTMTSRFWHVVNRVWVVEEGNDGFTVLLDWTSTTYLNSAEDTPAVVPQFTVMKLSKSEEAGRGIHGLWINSLVNWMDPSPVKAVRDVIRKEGSASAYNEAAGSA